MKYIILISSVVIQLCLGGVYAWSSLVPALEETLGMSIALTQIIFGALFGTFTVSMVLAGKLLNRFGPRIIAGIGGILFASGYLIASVSGGNVGFMLLGVSLLGGAGTGFGYVVPLTTGMKWFPENRGLVTGVSMAGFGGGAVLLSALVERFLSGGMHVLEVFRWIGLAYGAALLMAAAILRFPAASTSGEASPAPPLAHLLRDPFFQSLVIGMFCGTFAGMLVIGNLKPMALAAGIPSVPAAVTISAFALGNAAGRITWGWISDRADERMIPVKMAALGIPLVLLIWTHSSVVFIFLSFAVGFGFGASFVVYAAQVASKYGPGRVSGIYPVVFLAYGAAGLTGPAAGGWMYDVTSSYTPAILLSSGVLASGLIATAWLLRRAKYSRAGQLGR